MFGIGGMELFIILLVALIVLGPGKLPGVARMLGKAMGELQKATSDLKREIDISVHKKSTSSDSNGEDPFRYNEGDHQQSEPEEKTPEKDKEG